MTGKNIIIGISGKGVFSVDGLKVEKIVIDNQAHRLLLRRANEDGITMAESLRKTLNEAINEYIDKNTFV